MEAEELYQRLLHLTPPWQVKRVIAEAASARVLVYLDQTEAAVAACPVCGRACAVCGETEERSWRHLNTCQLQTHVFAKLALVDCPEHGEQPAAFPLAQADSPVTFAFAQWLRQVAKEVGNRKRLAAITRLDGELLDRILASSRQPGDAGGKAAPPASTPPKQLDLFAQNDMILVNQGLQALRTLQLERALELFRKHQKVYPKGPEVSSKIALAEFLLQGREETQLDTPRRISSQCHFWNRFLDFARSQGLRPHDRLVAEIQKAYFESLLRELDREGVADTPMIGEVIPLGYVHLQAGQAEPAIRHLQAAIPRMPDNAALYGYLGDAYWLRREYKVARQCYREGCLINPAALDWQLLKDDELSDLRHDLHLLYGFDEDLAVAWLPSYARVHGLFECKVVRLNDGLKELVDDYTARQKALAKRADPLKTAELFFRGIILCENEDNLRLIRKIDLIQVRRMMKQANPDLFAEFLGTVVASR